MLAGNTTVESPVNKGSLIPTIVFYCLALTLTLGALWLGWRDTADMDFANTTSFLPNLTILEAPVKAKVLAATSGGQTTTAATAYDLTAQCLTQGGLFEGTAELATRCQSEALEYLAKGSFPAAEKAAASRVVTDLVSRVVRQESN